MRIAISGSAGTGKTTLVKALADEFKLPMIEEGVREFMALHDITHLRELTPDQSMKMQWWLLGNKANAEDANYDTGFIADRSYADNMAYMLRWNGREADKQEEIKKYIGVCYGALASVYDVVFFLPYGVIKAESDGVRSPQDCYQLEMSFLIWGILSWSNRPTVVINGVSVEDRVREIRKTLTDMQLI